MSITLKDQFILYQDEDWRQRVQQALVSTAFTVIQEDTSQLEYQEAKRRQLLSQQVIQSPTSHVDRTAAILASQVPDGLVETDGSAVTTNNVTDTQLIGFVADNWSILAGVGSDLPDIE